MRKSPIVLALALAGCQTTLDPNYALQLESYRLTLTSNQAVEVARANAEAARYSALAEIYKHYVRETIVTFEKEPVADVEQEPKRQPQPRVDRKASNSPSWPSLCRGRRAASRPFGLSYSQTYQRVRRIEP